MDQFLGHWKLVKSDNFEAYLKAVNVSLVLRKVASRVTTYEEITQDSDNTCHLKLTSTFTTNTLTFQLGVPFKEITPSGHRMKTTITIEDDKWIQIQMADDPTATDSKVTRRLRDPDCMIATYEAGDVVAYRTMARYKP
ncbi:fatty acid-binding protein homolog 5-like [Octopus sinensis]|uniref:Fatty acid-binding protein homolog 5-like n=1 Tax=Octopus sinensis TaxID=2607531 RepID=A0A6P7TKC4_9MOLL|nr:fatty acid-binding protein homolog 5-like [Octopus sinensis]